MNTIEQEVASGLAYLHARDRNRMKDPLAWEWAKEHWPEFLLQLDSPTGKLLVRMARCAREQDRKQAVNSVPEPIGPEIDAVLSRIGPVELQQLNQPMRDALQAGAAADTNTIGSALAQHREQSGLTPEQQAHLLGIDLDGLVLLGGCRLPRRRHWDRDLHSACKRSGADPEMLAAVLLVNRLGSQ